MTKKNWVLKFKRVYEPFSDDDGFRIFVERLWPRGVFRQKAAIDLWLKEIAPSTELRKWFNHEPARWNEFRKRYAEEIKTNKELLGVINDKMSEENVTPLYASREKELNAANVLFAYLNHKNK